MGRHTWGKSLASILLIAVAAAVSGCSSAEAEDKKPATTAASPTVSLDEATIDFQAAVDEYDTVGCESMEPGTCWEQMQAVMEPTSTLRQAMNTEESVGPEFWSEAYSLIDIMEEGMAVGEDEFTNRPKVLGSAHDLYDWLDEHPVK
ncbi:hypothetical protein [Streptomyces sp. NBC_00620]|uniref:hypothetical protein n=1 Tax=Streptomyces sp. NBC_00620 TaxID=2903666 RepID=UPI002258EA9E|nr:hypothetical protein [Streptomyces sp. NBC_00620]MCX4976479.1 hypothetical protein [Streptomyces sp. NBC_00620]